MDGGTTGGPVVKTRVCMGIAASTLARLLQVSSNDQAKGGLEDGTAECDGDGTSLSKRLSYEPSANRRAHGCDQDALCDAMLP